jgi:hypothetical protein
MSIILAQESLPVKLLLSSLASNCIISRNFSYIYTMATKKVPQRRNKNAGKSTGKSKSAKRLANCKACRERKKKYDTAYHATAKRKKYRAKLNTESRKGKCPPGYDVSHNKDGSTRCEKRSVNRARNGKKGSSKK